MNNKNENLSKNAFSFLLKLNYLSLDRYLIQFLLNFYSNNKIIIKKLLFRQIYIYKRNFDNCNLNQLFLKIFILIIAKKKKVLKITSRGHYD
jgi:hypothetical protein